MNITSPIRRLAFFAIAIVAVLFAAPLLRVKAAPPTNPDIVSNGCTVTLSFTAPAANSYYLELFDDLSLVYLSNTVTATAGQLVSFNFTFPGIGGGVAGIGIYLYENGTRIFSVDPYTVIDQTCNKSACAEGGYQGVTTAWTKLHWGTTDSRAVVPDTFIPPNKRLTVVDNAVPGWYRVAWACKYYYVKVGTLNTNFEKGAKPFLNGR